MRQVLYLFYWWADIENSFHATFDHHDELSRMKEHNFLLLQFYLKLCPKFEGMSYFRLFGSVKGFNFFGESWNWLENVKTDFLSFEKISDLKSTKFCLSVTQIMSHSFSPLIFSLAPSSSQSLSVFPTLFLSSYWLGHSNPSALWLAAACVTLHSRPAPICWKGLDKVYF